MIFESLISIIIAVVIVVLMIRNKRRSKYKAIIDYLEESLINNAKLGLPFHGLCSTLNHIYYSSPNKYQIKNIRKDIEEECQGTLYLERRSLKKAYDFGTKCYDEAVQIRLDLLNKLRKKYNAYN